MKVSPVKNHSESHIIKTTYDLTKEINVFLSRLYLLGVKRNVNNEIVAPSDIVRFLVFLLSYITIITVCTIARVLLLTSWQKTWDISTYLNSASGYLTDAFVLLTFISIFRTKPDNHQEYHSNYESIDSILQIKSTSDYDGEKRSLEKIFFIPVYIYSANQMAQPALLWVNGTKPFYMTVFSDHIIGIFVIFLVEMYIISKLVIFRRRFKKLVHDVTVTLKKMQEGKCSNAVKDIIQLKRCYQLLCKQNYITCNMHGWQVRTSSKRVRLLVIRHTSLNLIMSRRLITQNGYF